MWSAPRPPFAGLVEPRRRAEKVLLSMIQDLSVIQEAYVHDVSTRKLR